jgi:outer membrane protein assembly factor BamB
VIVETFPLSEQIQFPIPRPEYSPVNSLLPTLLISLLAAESLRADDWPAWRGPHGNGTADPDQEPPISWSETSSVIWKSPVPGRGHSSPVLSGDHIFLTTADEGEKTQSVLAFDRNSGNQLWQTEVHRVGLPDKLHRKNTHATPTPACDGERVFAVFNNGDGITLSALDLDGKLLWQVRTGDYRSRYPYGYGASPLLHGSLVIVASEFETDGYLAAFDRETGKEIWRTTREISSYSSPIVGKVAGRDLLLISANQQISAYDPLTGQFVWSAPGATQVTAATVIWEDNLVFASGGFPGKTTSAVQVTDGGTKAAALWSNDQRCYEQSLLVHDGYLYAVNDGGIAICWRARDGREMWKERLGGGPISASPILANGHIYATVERGITYVFKADPGAFELVAENTLGNETFATPAIVDHRIFIRVAENTGDERREWLYCIGAE